VGGVIESPSPDGQAAFLAAVARSRRLHAGLVAPPATPEAFTRYLERLRAPSQVGYWVRTSDGELAGAINISEIVRGVFCSAYLGYYAFSPHNGRGHMTLGMRAVLREAFVTHRLHRLEANIQPGNEASSALVRRLGFSLEGFSPRYLKIGGRWRDHERWALTVEAWRAGRRASSTREEAL
jgi:ribosomal-protein-alanine N-acetyltransferase